MNHIEAMKQALEALVVAWQQNPHWQINEAITTLRAAIEQAEKQQSVGEVSNHDWSTGLLYRDLKPGTLLYTAPRATPEQEPVALETVYETIIHWDEGGGKRSRRELARRIVDLYTTPPAAPVQEPPDDELTQALIERDETEAIADELAQAIAQITGADIGEHTSANCPWRRALDAAEDFMCHPPAAQRQWVGLEPDEIKRAPHHMVDGAYHYSFKQGAEWAEAKLREKNGF